MIQVKLCYALATLLTLVTTMQITVDEETTEPSLRDIRNNVTDEDYNQILQAIKEAEGIYVANDYLKIAKYIAMTAKIDGSTLPKWSVYVHEGRIRQIGVSTTSKTWRQFLVLLNPGKYNLSYTLVGCVSILCNNANYFNGGQNYNQFSNATPNGTRQFILGAVDYGMRSKGSDIMGNADVIASEMYRFTPTGVWNVVIADPSARFGYYICMNLAPIWFSLRAYGELKWNYFGSLHPAG